ncbi:hypothetical protein V8F44DRAFT_637875 [Aspergillus fumigatus]
MAGPSGGIPFVLQSSQERNRYIKKGNIMLPYPPFTKPEDILGLPLTVVLEYDHSFVRKSTFTEMKWDTLGEKKKESICLPLWDMFSKVFSIPRSPELKSLFQCLADRYRSRGRLLEDLQSRICERYIHCGGSRYKCDLPEMLPHSVEYAQIMRPTLIEDLKRWDMSGINALRQVKFAI